MANDITIKNIIKQKIENNGFIITNQKAYNKNLIRLEEMRTKNNYSYLQMIKNSNNAVSCAMTILDLSNEGKIINEDFDILPFNGELKVNTYSSYYQSLMNDLGYETRKMIIYKGEDFEWDEKKFILKYHKVDLNADTKKYENIIGAYAYVIKPNGITQGVLLRKSDIDLLKAKSNSTAWESFPRKIAESKLYRELAKELNIKFKDIDETFITTNEDGNVEYKFKDIDTVKNQGAASDELPINNTISTPIEEIADTPINNVVKEDDISNVVPVVNNNNDEEWVNW